MKSNGKIGNLDIPGLGMYSKRASAGTCLRIQPRVRLQLRAERLLGAQRFRLPVGGGAVRFGVILCRRLLVSRLRRVFLFLRFALLGVGGHRATAGG